MKKIINDIESQIRSCEKNGEDLDSFNWEDEHGVLLTANEAKKICEFYKSQQVKPKGETAQDIGAKFHKSFHTLVNKSDIGADVLFRAGELRVEMNNARKVQSNFVFDDFIKSHKVEKCDDAAFVWICLKIAQLENTIKCLSK